jgi:serine/threonine protein kinase/tetratricopeptide (TPR) repeat protein
MIGQTLSHFRIVDKIGEGGMGVVYRAEDIDLGREVALKVLHTEFVTDDERRKRFMREARTAASVTHPNIATVHEVGEHDGVIFIAMELVEGRTLKRVLHDQPPAVDECLRLGIEICEGLARAHQSNIIHRDLKPENIVIDSEGRVKILDFGLAKLYEDPTGSPRDDSSGLQTISAAVTRDGRILGTVQYMSPEQARGVELDARSDVFSLGIVLYELVTGQSPFQGETITDTLTSILRDQQPPIARYNPQVPVELERILARCLEKDPARRYQHAAAVLADLRKLKRMSDSQPVQLVSDSDLVPRLRERLPWKRVAGLAAAAVLLVVIGAGAAALFRGMGWLPASGAKPKSLAVLPFDNLQERDDPERLGQILQELIITDLSEMESLKVLSSQRLFDVQKQLGRDSGVNIDRDIATRVASRAGADMMLTGSLSRLGPTWILTVQLIKLTDGTVIKSERIDGGDLYAMVDELTTVIRDDLGMRQAEDLAITQRTSSSLEAYQAYLAGVDALNERKFKEAADHLQRAVDVDPTFGKAFYKLAIARWWRGSLENFESGRAGGAPGDALRELLSSEVKLPRKDRLLGDAFLRLVDMQSAEAAPMFQEIVELYPDEKEAWYGLGEALFHGAANMSERSQALDPFEKAIELDPSFTLAFQHIVDLYIQSKKIDEGIERVRAFIDQNPDSLTWYEDLTRLAIAKGDRKEIDETIEDSLQRIDGRSDQRNYLLGVAKAAGRRDMDLMETALLRAKKIKTDAYEDRVLVGLGDLAAARGEFDKAEPLLLQAHEADIHNTTALKTLFWFYDRTRRYDEAVRRARALIDEDPTFDPYYAYWLEAAIKKGDRKEVEAAEAAIQPMLTDDTGAGDALIAIGSRAAEAYFKIGDFVNAEQILQRGLESEDPMVLGKIYNSLGWAALNLARPREALDWFGKAIDTGLIKEDPLVGMTRARIVLGQTDKAIDSAKKLDELTNGSGWARAKLIESLVRAGHEDKAKQLYKTTLEELTADRDRKYFFQNLAQAYLAMGRFTEAEEAARKAESLLGTERESWVDELLTWTLMHGNKTAEAEAVLEVGLAANPESANLLLLKAFNYLVAGDPEAAESQATDLLKRGPALADAHVAMAYSLGGQGRFDEAMKHAERVLKMNPNRSNRTLMAWVLIAGNIDIDRGLEMAVKATDTPESYFEAAKDLACLALAEHCLGVAYLKQGRYEEAVDQLNEASRMRPGHRVIQDHLEQASKLSLGQDS